MSQRGIVASCGHSQQIVKDVIGRSKKKEISLPSSDEMTDSWLQEVLFPEKNPEKLGHSIPEFEYLHKELAKS